MAENSIDLYRTEPGTLAGRYLRSFWQPVYRARKTWRRAKRYRCGIKLGEDFLSTAAKAANTMWSRFAARTGGRGFSAGWVEDDCIRCFYHGWKYDPSGQCVEQPGEDAVFKSKIKIRSYPTEEYLGLIFAFLGDGAAPPLPAHYSDLDAGGIVDVLLSEEWPCNYFNRLDNLGDPVHVPFTRWESRSRIGVDVVVPDQLVAQENDVGIKLTRNLAIRTVLARFFGSLAYCCTLAATGDPIELAVDTHRLHFFDPDGGSAIYEEPPTDVAEPQAVTTTSNDS